jgi:rod shape-determining protein MreB
MGNRFFSPSLRMVIGVPSGSTEVELRAVRDSAEHAGGRDVYLIFEPMAAAIGIGIDVEAPEGNMIVDIGGGSTEIAVISLGGIVSNNSIRVAGDDLTADIQEYMSRQHNVRVSERMAERIKIHVGAALTDLGDDAPEDYIVRGPNRITALPMEVPVNYKEIAHCLEKSIAKIETAILSALENTPPELYADIVVNGIYLAGGGALLRGLDKRLTDKINIPFHIAEDPLLSVAKGTGIALKNVDRFSFLMR